MSSVWKRAYCTFQPDRFTLLLAALAVLGTGLVLLHEVTYGVTLEWDSVTYISVARNLLAGNGFMHPYDGAPYLYWPPLFPGLLALASLFVFDPYEVAGLVNAIAFGLTIIVAGQWLRRRIESPGLALWGCLAITLSAPLLQNAAWAISEPVFILFTLLTLVETEIFLTTERRSSLLRSALFTAFACLTRYIGLSIVITVVLVLLFKSAKPFLEKVRHMATYAFIAVTPLGLWLLRNMLVSGTLTGHARSHPPFASFPEYLQQTLDVLAAWAVPFLDPVPAGVAITVGLALLALAIRVGMAFYARREAEIRSDENTIALFGAFTLIYLAFLLVAASSTPVGIGARHICPVYISLLFIVALTLDTLLRLRSQQQETLLRTVFDRPRARMLGGQRQVNRLAAVMASVLALWLAGSAIVTGRSIQAANGDGSEYFSWNLSRARFVDSAVLQYLREHPVTGWVYSNEHFAVYIHTDGLAKYTLLHRTEQQLVQALRECASATAGFQCAPPLHRDHGLLGERAAIDQDVHIVWLDDAYWRQPDYNSLDLRALPGVETVAELADGVVLRVTPGTVFDRDSYLANKAALITAPIEEAGQPILRSTYDVYVTDTELIYVKDACSEDDTEAIFSLHWAPTDKAHLADYWKEYGFNVRDFRLEEYGVKSGDRCVAAVRLPAYAISQIKTGQFVHGPDKELVWLWRERARLAD